MPKGGGGYRLFAYVHDDQGGAAVANVALRVKGPVIIPKGKPVKLPLVIYEHPALLATLLQEDWFRLAPPKSTGREHFHLAWLQAGLGTIARAPQDVQATLVELTAASVADALLA